MGTTKQQFLRQPTVGNYNHLLSELGLAGSTTHFQLDQSNVPIANKSNNKIEMPVVYDGESNWEYYFVQFKLEAAINKWDDSEKASGLLFNSFNFRNSLLFSKHIK